MKSYDKILNDFKSDPVNRHLRLGQYFVMNYIRGQWSELYYTEDKELTERLIKSYLEAFQYFTGKPPVVKKDHAIKVEFRSDV